MLVKEQVSKHIPFSAILILVGLAAATRLPFFFGSVFGEPDAARLATDALIWFRTGAPLEELASSRLFTSPGYIVLALAMAQPATALGIDLVLLLNLLNLIVGILIVVPLVALFRRLTDERTALLGGLAFLGMPVAWYASLYGFPHLLALACLVLAALLYLKHVTEPGSRSLGLRRSLGVGLLLTTAILLKADAYFAAAAFPALALHGGRLSGKRLLEVGILVGLPVIIALALPRVAFEQAPVPVPFMEGFLRQYPLDLRLLLSPWHRRSWLEGFGLLTAFLALGGVLVVVLRDRLAVALMVALWLAGTLAFWYGRPGDSIRHHLPEAVPVALLVGLGAAAVSRRLWPGAVLVVAGAVAAQAGGQAFGFTHFPGGRVVENAPLHRQTVAAFDAMARSFAEVPECQKVLLGGLGNPYADALLLLRTDSVITVERRWEGGFDAVVVRYRLSGRDCEARTVRTVESTLLDAASLYADGGAAVYSGEFDLLTATRLPSPHLQRLAVPPGAGLLDSR